MKRENGQSFLSMPLKTRLYTALMIFAIVIVFEACFWGIYAVNHWLAGFFAIAYSVSLALCKNVTPTGKAVRFASFAGIGSAIFARSEYWINAVFSNFSRLLNFDEYLPATEQLVTSEKPWVIFIIAAGFLLYYWLMSQWPELINQGNRLSALSLCAATQTVILTASFIPTVSTISASILLGAIFTVLIQKKVTLMTVLLVAAAPSYGATNALVFATVAITAAITLLHLLNKYEIEGRLRGVSIAVLTFNLLSPLFFLAENSIIIDTIVVLTFATFAFTVRFLNTPLAGRAGGLVAVFMGTWYSVIVLPTDQILLFSYIAIFASITAVLFVQDFGDLAVSIGHSAIFSFLILITTPFYSFTFAEGIMFSSTVLVILIIVSMGGFFLRRNFSGANSLA